MSGMFTHQAEGPTCWVVSDGRTGIENQALGLAEAVARATPLAIDVKAVRTPPLLSVLPGVLAPIGLRRMGAVLPDLWIACGRRVAPLSVEARRRGVFVVQIQNPRMSLNRFDLVIPPVHDRLSGENVFSIHGSPNRITRERIATAAHRLMPKLRGLPKPLVAILIGGPNRSYRYGLKDLQRLTDIASEIARSGAGLVVSTSRRSPRSLTETMREALDGAPHLFFDVATSPPGANPYPGILGLARHILVTEDSVNMIAEAVTVGAPVQIVPLANDGTPARKFRSYHAYLKDQDAARRFAGVLEDWVPPCIDETARAAAEVIRRWQGAR